MQMDRVATITLVDISHQCFWQHCRRGRVHQINLIDILQQERSTVLAHQVMLAIYLFSNPCVASQYEWIGLPQAHLWLTMFINILGNSATMDSISVKMVKCDIGVP